MSERRGPGDVPVRPAATAVVVRPARAGGLELLLVKRAGGAGFMAGAHVFPGGRVEAEDADPGFVARLPAAGARGDVRMHALDEVARRAHVVAVVRETFEEAGVLLASRADGRPLGGDLAGVEALGRWRDDLNGRRLGFLDLLEREDLRLDTEGLAYFDHWVTPRGERRRYDTRFFVTAVPEAQGQLARPDEREVTDSIWCTAVEALAAYGDGRIRLAPPTWSVLVDLAAAAAPRPEEALAWARARPELRPIRPTIARSESGIVLALPGDALHDTEASPGVTRRIVLQGGRWRLLGHPPR